MEKHPNVVRIWTEWVLENGNYDTELVIETDLPLNANTDSELMKLQEVIEFSVAQNITGNHRRVRVISRAT